MEASEATSTDLNVPDGPARSWAGHYGICHDGWPGALQLDAVDSHRMTGTFLDLGLWGRVHEVSAAVAPDDPGRLDLYVHNFNELSRQQFTGHAIGEGRRAFSGVCTWRSQAFGFFARRGPVPLMAGFGPGVAAVTKADFLGMFVVHHAGGVGRLEITRMGNQIVGRFSGDGGETVRTAVRAGGEADHHVRFDLPVAGGGGRFEGYLFTRPKNGIAGVLTTGSGRSGCYLVRVAGS